MSTFYADLNPNYPAKGERRYCIFHLEDWSNIPRKLPRQFNALRPAERFATKLIVAEERRRKPPYLGD